MLKYKTTTKDDLLQPFFFHIFIVTIESENKKEGGATSFFRVGRMQMMCVMNPLRLLRLMDVLKEKKGTELCRMLILCHEAEQI